MNISNGSSYPITYVILMCFLWAGFLLQNVAYAFFIHIPGCAGLGEYFVPGTIVIFSLLSLSVVLRKIRLWDILFYVVIALLYIKTYTWHPENGHYLKEFEDGFLYNTLLLYFFGVVLDFNALKKYLYYVSLVTVYVSFVWYFILNISGGIDFTEVSSGMTDAYAMQPHLMFVIWHFLEKENIKDGIALFLGGVFMLSMGNRGSILTLLVFTVLFLLIFKQFKSRSTFKKAGIIILTGILYFFLDTIIFFFGWLVYLVGGSMRIFEKLSNTQDLVDDSGRSDIRERLVDNIGLFNGHGFAGDQGLVGTYSHNLFFEWAVSFGIVITVLLIGALVFLIIKAYWHSPTYDEKMFVIMLLCCTLKLMVSGTFLSDNMFFMVIGYLVHQCRIPNANLNSINTDAYYV